MTDGADAVDAWFDEQSHSMTAAARAIRSAIMRAAPGTVESIKWKAPNFALDDDYATFSLRRPGILQVILHTGVRPRPELAPIRVGDLGGRLRWAGHNRAVITFTSIEEVAGMVADVERVIVAWTSAQASSGGD